MPGHAAVTIISKNYLALAETLAQSYLLHHPSNDFIVVLVDRADGYVGAHLACGAEVIEIATFALPDISRFIYRYSIMELNTAVKPFVLHELLERRGYETLLYIDPDILVFKPFSQVYAALKEASIILTPHIRRPYHDDLQPSEITILQSGTYNLGFIGLRNDETARELLQWWMTKVHTDCRVDIARGLFVDQKWIDLVPGFFSSHKIIYDPGYNVAYWNLHERKLSLADGEWLVDGCPLIFVHFSGYDPLTPRQLSKHQNRHDLASLPLLRRLADFYGQRLLDAGYFASNAWPYAFEVLANGARMPLQLISALMQWAVRSRIETPCPVTEPDEFCQFVMARSMVPGKPKVTLLYEFLLQTRGDVVSAFPNSLTDSDDPGFREWIRTSGVREYALSDLLKYEGTTEVSREVVHAELRPQEASESAAPQSKAWWRISMPATRRVAVGGRAPGRPGRAAHGATGSRVGSISRILNIYYSRVDLQSKYSHLAAGFQLGDFCSWLTDNRWQLRLTNEDIRQFSEYAKRNERLLEKMRYLYWYSQRGEKASSNVFAPQRRCDEINSTLTTSETVDLLFKSPELESVDYFLGSTPLSQADRHEDVANVVCNGLTSREQFAFRSRIQSGLESRKAHGAVVNCAGYFSTPTGMGESGRSMLRTLKATASLVKAVCLPNVRVEQADTPITPFMFGWPSSHANVAITVANADVSNHVVDFLPRQFWAQRNVGFWVWETEELPHRFGQCAAPFDEIWAPSTFAAAAIQRTIRAPVHVLPHVLDFDSLAHARADRSGFGVPEKATLFGFVFDPDSNLERKNVWGLVWAFRDAFRADDDCFLLLKVNGTATGSYEYEMLQARASSDRVLFVDRHLSRADLYNFIATLDVYVSLHRAEGFGVTCAEAMAIGVPVVASNYSGNCDFMTHDSSVLVPTARTETTRPHGQYPAGTIWGEPDHDAAVDALRSLLVAERRRKVGAAGKSQVVATLGAAKVGAQLELLLGSPAVRNRMMADES